MGQHACPNCHAAIPTENINIGEGAALCATCGRLSRLSEVLEPQTPIDDALQRTPPGCLIEEHGDLTVIRVSGRSTGTAVFFGCFALFWNSIVLVFVTFAVAGLYSNLVGPLPDWFPEIEFEGGDSLGSTIFLCIFLIPFILVGLATLAIALVALFGSVQVRLRGHEGVVRTGVGPLRWTRRFDAGRVKSIAIGRTTWTKNNQHQPVICVEADRTVKFGSMLRKDRLDWLRAALTVLLVSRDARARDLIGRQTFKPRDFRR